MAISIGKIIDEIYPSAYMHMRPWIKAVDLRVDPMNDEIQIAISVTLLTRQEAWDGDYQSKVIERIIHLYEAVRNK